MTKYSYRVVIIGVMLWSILFSACSKHKEFFGWDGPTEDENYKPPVSIADVTVVSHPCVILGYMTPEYAHAVSKRFTNLKHSVTAEIRAVVVTNEQLSAFTSEVLQVYRQKGVVVIPEPNADIVNAWFNQHGIALSIPKTKGRTLAAFYLDHLYSLDAVPEGEDINEYMNPLMAWTNNALKLVIKNPISGTDDIQQLIDPQTITKTYNFELNKEIGLPYWGLNRIKGVGQVTVRYEIYPLYAFEGDNSSGDYYIVRAQSTVSNAGMYQGCNFLFTNSNSYTRTCGYYMTSLKLENKLHSTEGISVGQFPILHTPTPKTTISSTTYTSGFSWELGGKIRIGTSSLDTVLSKKTSPVLFQISFDNKENRNIADIDIKDLSSDREPMVRYDITKLPIQLGELEQNKISPPVSSSISNMEFLQSWIWRVSTTKDNESEQVKFSLHNKMEIQYGYCYSYIGKKDEKTGRRSNPPAELISRIATISDTSHYLIIPPSRVPMGTVRILNSNQGEYVTQIEVSRSSDDHIMAKSTGSFAYGRSFNATINAGIAYKIKFKMGSSIQDLKSYTLVGTPVVLEKDADSELNSSFDFIELE